MILNREHAVGSRTSENKCGARARVSRARAAYITKKP